MMRIKTAVRPLTIAAAFCAGLATAGLIQTAVADQPYMVSALESLRAARAALVSAEPNKGGHRERALELVNGAIAETEAGIAFAR
ncbi:hypothetical protein ABLE93_03305 [Xanthobacter sp. KR7-65]|uniref:hypothetical protein n=1 Tax=Xanthobacter sp. KR7-65 TaxID=3156612 RepID=UPI0032B55E4A